MPLSLSEDVARRPRKRGLRGRTVKLKLRYSDFTTLTRQVTLDVPTDMEQVIFEQAAPLLEKAWDRRRKVRLIGVGVSKFEPEERQLSLFEGRGEGKEAKLRGGVYNPVLDDTGLRSHQPGVGPRRPG